MLKCLKVPRTTKKLPKANKRFVVTALFYVSTSLEKEYNN